MLRCRVLQKCLPTEPEFSRLQHISEVMTEQVRATRLANGATILTEFMPGLRSATLGIWVRRGARHEPANLNGICHFIEHTVFKGTERRTAFDIAVESDRLGGHLDAYTSHEVTGFTLKVVDTALAPAFDLLADMLLKPRFDEQDLQLEQRVIIEEMKMVEDSPEEFLGELFNAAYFPDHALGRPIEGTAETVSSFNHERTARFHAEAFAPRNLIIAAAGNVSHEQLVELAARACADIEAAAHTSELDTTAPPVAAAPIFAERKQELEQAHLILATPWPSARHEDRYTASLLASVIGGGT